MKLNRGYSLRKGFLVSMALVTGLKAHAQEAAPIVGVTAVAAKVSPDYIRAKLPDGTFVPETYAFGKGGNGVAT
jgi:hypothetical protein